MMKAPVNKIIPFSNVDGPGNRTAVFFQGCPFNCLFCHNPETIHMCRDCGACVPGCPAGALEMDAQGHVRWAGGLCVQCDRCIKTCPHDASPKVTWMTVDDVMARIRRSAPYIDGITVSGGECTLRYDFLIELFARVQALHKTCLADSNGSFDFEHDPRLLEVCDGVMLDVKAANPAWHKRLTGAPLDMVVHNLRFLLKAGKLQEVRTVIFPYFDAENVETVRFVAREIGSACDYKIIRYRPYGVRKACQKIMGDTETDEAYAGSFAALARQLGAERAYVI